MNVNGRLVRAEETQICEDNGAYRYGYGVFETMLVIDGHIELETYHMDRLFSGIGALHLHLPSYVTPTTLAKDIRATVQKNTALALCRVRVQVFAGVGGMYGADFYKGGFTIACLPIEPDAMQLNENGLVVGIASGLAKSPDSTSHLKTCNALIYALAAHQARSHKWNDALIRNTAGRVIETTIGNLFWVSAGRIFTPPLSEGCIAGVMRRHIMSAAAVAEQELTEETLFQADEVFFTNAIRRIRWVGSIGDKNFGHSISRQLYQQLFQTSQ